MTVKGSFGYFECIVTVPWNNSLTMRYTLIAIALLALTWSIEGKPVAKQVRSIRKARQTSFEPLFGLTSHFGNPYVGGRLTHQDNGLGVSAHGTLDKGGNWEAGAGLGVGNNGWRLGVDGVYRSDSSYEIGAGVKIPFKRSVKSVKGY